MATATLHEAGGKIGALPSAIKPMEPAFTICGPAFTVHSPPGDNLWLHRAIAVAQPGDVLVVFTERRLRARLLGRDHVDRGRRAARRPGDRRLRARRRLLGRSASRCSRAGCASAAPAKTSARGWINDPLLLGDITVDAGDLIVGDRTASLRFRARLPARPAPRNATPKTEICKRLNAGETTMQIYSFH